MADNLSIWVPFFSAMGGGAITIAAQYLSDRRRERSQRNIRRDESRERVLLKRMEFQSEALIELLHAVHALGKAASGYASSGKAVNDVGRDWLSSPDRIELYNVLKPALDDMKICEKKIFDDNLIPLSLNFRQACTELIMLEKFDVDQPEMQAFVDSEVLLLEEIRRALRLLDRETLNQLLVDP